MKRRAVFFDRDDTLMVNVPYLGDPSKVEIFPEASEALFKLHQSEFWLFVVSNQSGVGRKLITRNQVFAVNVELERQLGGDYIRAFYHSFATPDDPKATDRKPSPELLFKAAEMHGLDLAGSFFVGDRLSDIECGLNAGCRTVLLMHPKSSRHHETTQEDLQAQQMAHYLAGDLMDATQWILQVSSAVHLPKTHELE
ncbi:MAG TPA: HAD-IIIA family hydrolase [Candidatus Methylacidiphilales bacterium]|nr:HAD-IIIA family hydrolase [Candidatus Methylacidiphilales bacterium]